MQQDTSKPIIAIIAEFDPFHLGHAYLIQEAKRLTGADRAIIMMSGDFVQRGLPAIVDKYTRTRMALLGGADVVLEIPTAFATGGADYFGDMAVRLLDALGCVDYLCFGCENASSEAFSWIRDVLSDEPERYRVLFQERLRCGATYPEARMEALVSYAAQTHAPFSGEEICEVLSFPNNALALEYMISLKRIGSRIKPFPIQRQGAGYHEGDLQSGSFASATAIRQALITSDISHSTPGTDIVAGSRHTVPDTGSKDAATLQSTAAADDCLSTDISAAFDYLPASGQDVFYDALRQRAQHIHGDSLTEQELLHAGSRMVYEAYDRHLQFALWQHMGDLETILDITPDIARRMRSTAFQRQMSAALLTDAIRARHLTESRIRRCLLHAFLGITQEETDQFRAHPENWYVRLLGFKKTDAASVLHLLKEHSSIPVIAKAASADKQLSTEGQTMFERDLHAGDMYAWLEGHDDFFGRSVRMSPVIM